MRELPSGTVSLVFSDIEGSTLLLNRLGDAYSDALDVHRRILRQAWAAWTGWSWVPRATASSWSSAAPRRRSPPRRRRNASSTHTPGRPASG